MRIRTRFTLLFALLVGVILSFFSVAIFYLSEDYRQTDFHARLEDRAIARLKLLMEANQNTGSEESAETYYRHSLLDERIWIVGKENQLLYKDSGSWVPSKEIIQSVTPDGLVTFISGGEEYIGFRYAYKGDTYTLFATAQDEYGMRYIGNLKRILLVRGLILMLVIVFSGWLLSGLFLKPISKIVHQADKITYSNLNLRLTPSHTRDEIGQLTSTFNNMLERLETSFNIQKRFVSNASHELRNPLTAIGGQIDVALIKDRSVAEYKAILESVSNDIKNVRQLANNLLELANSEVETLFQAMDEVRIDEILWDIQSEMKRQKPEYTVNVNFDKVMESEMFLTCKGKEKLLKIAFLNLVDNACR